MKTFNALLFSLLFIFTACAPTEPAVQDTVPITITRIQPTPTPTVAATPTHTPTPAEQTIVAVLAADGRFAIFLSLLETAGMTPLLNGADPYTVFAPTDEAFAQLQPNAVELLRADPELADFLEHHIVEQILSGHTLTQASVVCDVHSATRTMNDRTLQYGKNEAREIVIQGEGAIWSGEIIVTETDIEAVNGLIHAIASPIVPVDSPYHRPTIMQLLTISRLHIGRMREALHDAGGPYEDWPCREPHQIVDLLNGEQPYTLFLPTNTALEAAENEYGVQLADIVTYEKLLSYHIVSGTVMLPDLQSEQSFQTLSGHSLSVSHTSADYLTINGRQIKIVKEQQAKNGVIYFINNLLIPPDFDLSQLPPTITSALAAEPDFQQLLSFWDAEQLDDYFHYWGPFTIFVTPDSALTSLSPAQLEELQNWYGPNALFYFTNEMIDLQQPAEFHLWNNDQPLQIRINSSKVTVGNTSQGYASITRTIQASNGVIYVLDRPLIPAP
jgi:transforming growth factor-beta-induced protein